ncbi:MAG: hypothetical protein Q8K85_00915 [Hyphomicrobium sp.]|nr:hypothetical protein [Hyphomicrobium sp.]
MMIVGGMVIIHGAVVIGRTNVRTAVVHAGLAHLGMEIAHGATEIAAAAKVAHAAAEIAATAKASTETTAEVTAAPETAAAARHGVGCKTKGAE